MLDRFVCLKRPAVNVFCPEINILIAHDFAELNFDNLKLPRSNGNASEFKLLMPDQILLGYLRRPIIGVDGFGSMSHGKKIHVSCDTSVTKVSTRGLPAGFA